MTDTIARALAARAKGFTDKLFGGVATSPTERIALQQALIAAGVTAPDPAARSLATLAAARPRIGAILGDSISEQNTYAATPLIKQSIGYMNWAQALSGHAFFFDSRYNFGVSGQNSAQIAARVGQVVAAKPSFCVVLAGVNDQRGVQTYAQTIANLTTTYNPLIAAGILTVAVPILPLNAWGGGVLTGAEHRALERINTWIRTQAATTPGIVLADPTELYADNTLASGVSLGASSAAPTAYTYDGLHPSPRGAYWVGRAIANALAPYFPTPLPVVLQSPADVYDATNNAGGSRLPTSIVTATGGGTLGAGASGVAPASATLARTGGTTGAVTGSFVNETLPNGATINKFQMVATAPSGSAVETLRVFFGATVTPGEQIYTACNIEVSGISPDSLVGVQLIIRDGTNQPACLRYQDNFVLPNNNWSGTLVTPMNYTVPAGVTSINAYVEVILDGRVAAAGATVKVSKWKLATSQV